jgi:hypothetical protein
MAGLLTPLQQAQQVCSKFKRLVDHRGIIEVRQSEVAALCYDLGYRSSYWPHGDGLHWLASMLATVGKGVPMRQSIMDQNSGPLTYRSGFLVPMRTSAEYIAPLLNALVAEATGAPGKA